MSNTDFKVMILLKDMNDDAGKILLDELRQGLAEAGIPSEPSGTPAQGIKADVNTYLTITGLGFSAISTFISVISYIDTKHPRHSTKIIHNKNTYPASRLNQSEIIRITDDITSNNTDKDIVVHVSKNV